MRIESGRIEQSSRINEKSIRFLMGYFYIGIILTQTDSIMMKPVFISQKQKPIKKIDAGTIVYLFTKGNYTKIYFADQSFWEVRSSLYGALRKLPEGMFVRISESTAVSIYYIDSIYKY